MRQVLKRLVCAAVQVPTPDLPPDSLGSFVAYGWTEIDEKFTFAAF
jgi:hypothetical protein